MTGTLITPSHLQSLCKQYGLQPSKKYGQNYLINDAPIKKMIAAAEIGQSDTVIEIGPGFGVLTFALAQTAKKVVAFEIEKKLVGYWDEKMEEYPNIEIVWGNALHKIQDASRTMQTYKVVANLPYQITSHVLRTVLELEHKPESVTVMVQKEVADRICAKPGDMSLLAVSVQYYGTPKMVAKVTKGNFWPAPKVDSAVVHVDKIQDTRNTIQDEQFFRVVRAGFSSKRKQLWRNVHDGLGVDAKKVKDAIFDVTGNERIRAQELSVDQWKTVVTVIASEAKQSRT